MTELKVSYSDGTLCNYCLVCAKVARARGKGIRTVNLENYAPCGVNAAVLAVRRQQGSRAPEPCVHSTCYHNTLQPRQKELQAQAQAQPRTRAAVKLQPAPPAIRAPRAAVGKKEKLEELQREARAVTGLLSPYQGRAGVYGQRKQCRKLRTLPGAGHGPRL